MAKQEATAAAFKAPDEEEMEEATTSPATEISEDAAVVAVLLEVDGIFYIK